MKNILVFQNGCFFKSISYKNKTIAKKQYSLFKKFGMIDNASGEIINNLTFELI